MQKILIWNQHWTLDSNLNRSVRAAIQKLTGNGEPAVFYFLAQTDFTRLCLSQLRSVQKSTGRDFTAVYLSTADCSDGDNRFFRLIDRVEYPFGSRRLEEMDHLMSGQRQALDIYALRQCDALLCYFYPSMSRSEWNRIMARCNKPKQIVNLARPATENKIVQYMEFLKPEERLVFDGYRMGKTTRQINAELGGTYPSKISFLYSRAVFSIGRRFQVEIRAEERRRRERRSASRP